MTGATNQAGDVVEPSKATSSLAPHQLQKWAHTERGNSLGLCASIPAVVYDDMQACELGRGDVSPVLSRIQIGSILPLPQLRARAVTGCASLFHSLRLADCSPLLRKSLPYQQLVKCLADRRHFPKALSSVARLVGIDPNERRLTNATRSFAPGAKAND